jgi:hypothetical protein
MKKIILSIAIISLTLTTSCEKVKVDSLDKVVEMKIGFNKEDIKKSNINKPVNFPAYVTSLSVGTYPYSDMEEDPHMGEFYREFNFEFVEDESGEDDIVVRANSGINNIEAITNNTPDISEIYSMSSSDVGSFVLENKDRVVEITYYGKAEQVLFEEGVLGSTTIDMNPGTNRNIAVFRLMDESILNGYEVSVVATNGDYGVDKQFSFENNAIVVYEVNYNQTINYMIVFVDLDDPDGEPITKFIYQWLDPGYDTEWNILISNPIDDPILTQSHILQFNFLEMQDGGLIEIEI